jgi:hypothetical protein
MNRESVIHTARVVAVPKQTRPRMVVKSFRIPEPAWAAVVARAEREGLNPTEVVRELAIAWGKGDADD